MSQAVKIFVFAALAFLVYITSKGQLGTYLGFFKLGASDSASSGQKVLEGYGGSTPTITQDAQKVESAAQTAYQAAQAADALANTIQTANGQETGAGLDAIAAAIATGDFI